MAAAIYLITSPTEKRYVGQTFHLKKRETEYRLIRCKSQRKLYNSILKYGWESHKFEAIMVLRDDVSPEMLTYWEQFFIDYYRNLGYELLNIREGGSKGRLSEETKKKISLNHPEKGRTGIKSRSFKNYVEAFKEGLLIGKYEGIGDASRSLNVDEANISSVVLGKRKTAGGYTFKRLQ